MLIFFNALLYQIQAGVHSNTWENQPVLLWLYNWSVYATVKHREVVSAACLVHDETAFSHFSTDVVAEQATEEEMCPQFPEPVPLKHPIIPLKAALEKVDLFQSIFLIHIKV